MSSLVGVGPVYTLEPGAARVDTKTGHLIFPFVFEITSLMVFSPTPNLLIASHVSLHGRHRPSRKTNEGPARDSGEGVWGRSSPPVDTGSKDISLGASL
jgi:hypothetical protein